jgi:hypothetical protein
MRKKDVPERQTFADIYFESKTSEIVEVNKAEIEVNRLKVNLVCLIRTFDLLDGDDNRL